MSYTGGKASPGVYHAIVNQMPPHATYIEAFLGAGAIMRRKRPAHSSIGIDADEGVLAQHWKRDHNPSLTIICADAIHWLAARHWQADELVYADPPYPMSSRSTQRPYYAYEMTDHDHLRLLAALKQIPAMAMISSYPNARYEKELAGWRTITFPGHTRQGPSVEQLWMNYPQPTRLHDTRFIGSNYRERETIHKQQRGWVKRLSAMSVLQRQALLAALDEAGISHNQK